jgi:hypothetical protein
MKGELVVLLVLLLVVVLAAVLAAALAATRARPYGGGGSNNEAPPPWLLAPDQAPRALTPEQLAHVSGQMDVVQALSAQLRQALAGELQRADAAADAAAEELRAAAEEYWAVLRAIPRWWERYYVAAGDDDEPAAAYRPDAYEQARALVGGYRREALETLEAELRSAAGAGQIQADIVDGTLGFGVRPDRARRVLREFIASVGPAVVEHFEGLVRPRLRAYADALELRCYAVDASADPYRPLERAPTRAEADAVERLKRAAGAYQAAALGGQKGRALEGRLRALVDEFAGQATAAGREALQVVPLTAFTPAPVDEDALFM